MKIRRNRLKWLFLNKTSEIASYLGIKKAEAQQYVETYVTVKEYLLNAPDENSTIDNGYYVLNLKVVETLLNDTYGSYTNPFTNKVIPYPVRAKYTLTAGNKEPLVLCCSKKIFEKVWKNVAHTTIYKNCDVTVYEITV